MSSPCGSIDGVTLILMYLVVLVLVAVVLFGVGSVVFGRGERLPPLPHGTTATVLPASEVTGADVAAVKFGQTLRGYRVSEVDWVLDRLGQELDQVRGQLAAVRAAYGVDEFGAEVSAGNDAAVAADHWTDAAPQTHDDGLHDEGLEDASVHRSDARAADGPGE